MNSRTRSGKVALVTGANQGLGFASVERLCELLEPQDTVYLTARDQEKGLSAIERVGRTAPQLRFEQLNVVDDDSVAKCAELISSRHDGIDVVISNAAARIAKDVSAASQVEEFINTNNHGTYRMLNAFIPMLRQHGRFVVVASSFGTLRNLPVQLHDRFDVGAASLDDIESVMNDYVSAVQDGTSASLGWPEWINIPSKIGQVASAKIAARDINSTNPHSNVLVNAVCPGLVDTEASRPWFDDMSNAQSPAEAAVDVVWLALLSQEINAPQGELVQLRKILPWR